MPTYPLPNHRDGRLAVISDGFHSMADVRAGKAKRQHRGADCMYRKAAASTPVHPFSSKWYEIPADYCTPVLAPETGVVMAACELRTGWWVALGFGKGRAMACHHLKGSLVTVGNVVGEGTVLGFVGGSPTGYGLYHAHVDYATDCGLAPARLKRLGRLDGKFVDPAEYLKGCRHVSLESTGFG